jgi:hypothetical protein
VVQLGDGLLNFIEQLRDMVWLFGRLLLDLVNLAKHPKR